MSSEESTRQDTVVKEKADKRKISKKRSGHKKKAKTVKTKSARKKAGQRRSSSRASRPYPQRTLEEALKIPQAIRDKNNGNPWSTEDVAQASLGVAKTNNKFFYAAAAARDYGLTIGTRDTDKIELAPLGKAVVFAGDEVTRKSKLVESFLSIDIFRRVYEHYGSANLPEREFLKNTLQSEFGLDAEFHEEFARLFKANCRFVGIEKGMDTRRSTEIVDPDEHASNIRVVGEPKGKFDRTAFVIMPFAEKGPNQRPGGFFAEVLKSLITPAGNGAGFAVETASQDGSDLIQSTIVDKLLKADLVVADLTDHNPNVLFELGIRIAKDKPIALIKAVGTGQIFDVDNMMRVVAYSPNLWATTLEQDIPKLQDHIKAAWDNRTTAKSYMKILTGSAI